MIILLIAGFSLIAAGDLPTLIKEKKLKDIIVFSIFFIAAFIVALLMIMNVDLPSIVKGYLFFFQEVLKIPSE